MRKTFALIVSIAALSGCASNTPLGKFALDDAKAASSLAIASNDLAGAKCYDYIAASLSGPSVAFTPGLLYLNEVKRTSVASSAGLAAACGGVLPIVIAP